MYDIIDMRQSILYSSERAMTACICSYLYHNSHSIAQEPIMSTTIQLYRELPPLLAINENKHNPAASYQRVPILARKKDHFQFHNSEKLSALGITSSEMKNE